MLKNPKQHLQLQKKALKLSALEQSLLSAGVRSLAGVDEVGRGCLAGPVVAACVIYPQSKQLPPVTDSKQLSAELREHLYDEICEQAEAWAIAAVEPEEIDRLNIHRASLRAMELAIEQLVEPPEHLLIDGRFPVAMNIPQTSVIGGDGECQVIAAASIIAKVWRDRHMVELEKDYPKFQFGKHKGYGTKQHREELALSGPTPIHRQSFKLI